MKIFFRLSIYCFSSLFLLFSGTIFAQNESEQLNQQAVQQITQLPTLESNELPQTEPANLKNFIRSNIQKNLDLRIKNSQQIFSKSVRNPQTSLFPDSLYKSLGYQLRDPFISHLPEISTRLYQVEDNSKLYFQMIRDLEKAWAILNTTQKRINNSEDWSSQIIENNLILDAVNMWYRSNRKDIYQQWMSELKIQMRKTRSDLEDQRQEYNDAQFSQLNIRILELIAENNEISQFLDTESAYLYVRTDERSLPKDAINTATYQFQDQVLCQPQAEILQIANIYLGAVNPDFFQIMAGDDIRNKVWNIAELSRETSKQLLLDPTNQPLQAVNYFLSNTVLSTLLLMKQKRLNAFIEEQDSIFIQTGADFDLIIEHPQIKSSQEFLKAIFDLILLDSFIASERESTLKLQLFRNCGGIFQDDNIIENSVQLVESSRFGGLQFPQAVDVKSRFKMVSDAWNGETFAFDSSSLKINELNDNIDAATDSIASVNNNIVFDEQAGFDKNIKESDEKKSTQAIIEQEKGVSTQLISSQSQLPFDSIKQASNKEAFDWLENNGFVLSTTQDILDLTSEVGYSIQVLTTSSASEAATVAKRYSQKNETKVYLSSVNIDGVVEKRYKILVSFRAGKANAQEFLDLKNKAEELRGFLKRYSVIRKDLFQ